jgi:hypothetical protein
MLNPKLLADDCGRMTPRRGPRARFQEQTYPPCAKVYLSDVYLFAPL